jgi:flagellar motility protein MotE (MotC chaperone)
MRMPKVRLLPVAMFVAALILSVKVGDIWTGLTLHSGSTTATLEQSIRVAPAFAQEVEGKAAEAPALGAAEGDDAEILQDTEIPEGMKALELETDEDVDDVTDFSPGEIRLLHDLARRRREIDSKARRLDQRAALLEAAEQKLIAKQGLLDDIRREVADMLAQYTQEQDKEAEKLRAIYGNMKPKSAARIFNEMDMDTLLKVLGGMTPRKVAPIVAAMTPEKARLLTREMAISRETPNLPK